MHKAKKFVDLSSRHKRRRIDAIRNNLHYAEDIAQERNGYDSSSDKSNENDVEDIAHDPNVFESTSSECDEDNIEDIAQEPNEHSSSSNDRSDHEAPQAPPPFAPEENVQNSDIESSDDDEATESSNEDDSEKEPQDNLEGGYGTNESSGDEEEDINLLQNLADLQRNMLKNAVLAAGLKHTQSNILLKTLRQFPFNLHSLPKDSRTLLQTPTVVASRFVHQIAGGEYLHIGFKNTLTAKLKTIPEDMLPANIEIDFSTDGGKAGTEQFWPHQYRVLNITDKRPMTAGIFKGRHKPSNPFDFFQPFIDEIIEVREEGGIAIGNKRLPVNVRCFIADAPARAFALNHYGHTSSSACSKCKVHGHRCTVPGYGGTMVFEGIRHPLRTDEEYRQLIDEDHHKGRSPLAALIGLVTRVPFEAMHLAWLGNMKKVISAHVDGKYGMRRLNARKCDIIDSRMRLLRSYCPSEFNRRPNEITRFHTFKATEFRQLLLYTAPAVLKNIMNNDYYDHLMILHCVLRILVSEDTSREMYPFCQTALESYTTLCEQLYGQQFLSYNVHALLHVVSDVEQLGPLETFSAFCYENNMTAFRKRVRKPGLSLQQYYKRTKELEGFDVAPLDNTIRIRLSQNHAAGPLPEFIEDHLCQQYNKLQVGKFTFATNLRDSCCILEDSGVCLIKNIVRIEEDIFFIVQRFRSVTEIYDVGVTSDFVNVCHCTHLSNRLQAVNLKHVKNKSYRMPHWSDEEGEEEDTVENEWICVSLLTPLLLPN